MDVVFLRWPFEHARRDELQRDGHPRLLLVAASAPPPVSVSDIEDWIRVPASDLDVRARVEALRARFARRAPGPELDSDGVLRLDAGWVALPPLEARLAAALVGRFGAVVSRDSLAQAAWPDGAPGRNALDVHMLRLRRRVSSLALVIRTVRSRGYLLERLDRVDENTSA